MIHIGGDWVGVNTANPNALAFEWVSAGVIHGPERIEAVLLKSKM